MPNGLNSIMTGKQESLSPQNSNDAANPSQQQQNGHHVAIPKNRGAAQYGARQEAGAQGGADLDSDSGYAQPSAIAKQQQQQTQTSPAHQLVDTARYNGGRQLIQQPGRGANYAVLHEPLAKLFSMAANGQSASAGNPPGPVFQFNRSAIMHSLAQC